MFGDSKLYQYLVEHSVRENSELAEADEMSRQAVSLAMQSLPEVLNFLQWLVITFNAKKILEIGTFTGISALAMAQTDPNVHITTLDNQERYVACAKQIWQKFNVEQQITLLLGDALQSCQKLSAAMEQPLFDLIFIDANKKSYPDYYEAALKLTRTGGIIVLDNTLMKGRVIEENEQRTSTLGVREVNKNVFLDNRVKITSIPLSDGMTLATKL